MNDVATRPLILVRGFGGLDIGAEQANAYQGFNEGTVYPGRRGDNYIYEGFLLRALKSRDYPYEDATNVVGYYSSPVTSPGGDLDGWDPADTEGTVVIDHHVARRVLAEATKGTLWVYRFHDLSPRSLRRYREGLVHLIGLIRKAVERRDPGSFTGVDLVCHSMGGLVMRVALLALEADRPGSAPEHMHRIVTLGTPHRGIAFQRLPAWLVSLLPGAREGSDELVSFSPESTRFREIEEVFPMKRILTVVGTDHPSYSVGVASLLNRLSSLLDEGTLSTNRSDGLVKHSSAQLPGAPRTSAERGDDTRGWAGPGRLIWEGWVDGRIRPSTSQGIVFRLGVYVGGEGRLRDRILRQRHLPQAVLRPGLPRRDPGGGLPAHGGAVPGSARRQGRRRARRHRGRARPPGREGPGAAPAGDQDPARVVPRRRGHRFRGRLRVALAAHRQH